MDEDTILLILAAIGALVAIIVYVCKVEYHFKYLKVFYPERLGRYKSRAHAQSKFFFAPDLDIELLLPFFVEKDGIPTDKIESITKLKRRIKNSLIIFWMTAIIVMILTMI